MSDSQSNKFPLVTVITPVYNQEKFLEETMLSVLEQDYPNIEYIVLDDGSVDNTLDIIKKYCGRIRWTTHRNMGETATVNKGFHMSNGEIVGVVNSDDPLLQGAISRIVQFMASKEELLVVYPDWNMIDSSGGVIRSYTTSEYSYYDMIRKHHCLPGPGVFFRRSVLDKVKGRDPQLHFVADFDFWLRVGLLGQFARIPETLATFRVHQGSSTFSCQGMEMAAEHIQLIKKIYLLPDMPDSVMMVKAEAFSSACYVAGCVCGNKSFFTKAKYFFSAIYSAPLMYFGEYKGRLLVMFLSFMGISEIQLTLKVDKIKRFLKKVSRIYRKKSDVTA